MHIYLFFSLVILFSSINSFADEDIDHIVAVDGYSGRTSGSFSVGDQGTANYVIPIATPGGKGVSLPLSFSYNSAVGEGVLGQGWSISGVSEITVCGDKLFNQGQDSFDQDRQKYCLEGSELVDFDTSNLTGKKPPFVDGFHSWDEGDSMYIEKNYIQKTNGYSKIVHYRPVDGSLPYFEVYDNNVKMTYGGTEDSLIRENITGLDASGHSDVHNLVYCPNGIDPDLGGRPENGCYDRDFTVGDLTQHRRVYSYLLHKVEDSYGRYVTLSYDERDTHGQEVMPDLAEAYTERTYLSEIRYTGDVNGPGDHVIRFHYELNDYRIFSFHGGKGLVSTQRIDSVDVLSGDRLLMRYEPVYTTTQSGKVMMGEMRSYEASGLMQKPTRFTYSQSAVKPVHELIHETNVRTDKKLGAITDMINDSGAYAMNTRDEFILGTDELLVSLNGGWKDFVSMALIDMDENKVLLDYDHDGLSEMIEIEAVTASPYGVYENKYDLIFDGSDLSVTVDKIHDDLLISATNSCDNIIGPYIGNFTKVSLASDRLFLCQKDGVWHYSSIDVKGLGDWESIYSYSSLTNEILADIGEIRPPLIRDNNVRGGVVQLDHDADNEMVYETEEGGISVGNKVGLPPGLRWDRSIFIDINADGVTDIVVLSDDVNDHIYKIFGAGNLHFGVPANASSGSSWAANGLDASTLASITSADVRVLDYENDGDQDFIIVIPKRPQIVIHKNVGGGNFEMEVRNLGVESVGDANAVMRDFTLNDLNQDGFVDFAFIIQDNAEDPEGTLYFRENPYSSQMDMLTEVHSGEQKMWGIEYGINSYSDSCNYPIICNLKNEISIQTVTDPLGKVTEYYKDNYRAEIVTGNTLGFEKRWQIYDGKDIIYTEYDFNTQDLVNKCRSRSHGEHFAVSLDCTLSDGYRSEIGLEPVRQVSISQIDSSTFRASVSESEYRYHKKGGIYGGQVAKYRRLLTSEVKTYEVEGIINCDASHCELPDFSQYEALSHKRVEYDYDYYSYPAEIEFLPHEWDLSDLFGKLQEVRSYLNGDLVKKVEYDDYFNQYNPWLIEIPRQVTTTHWDEIGNSVSTTVQSVIDEAHGYPLRVTIDPGVVGFEKTTKYHYYTDPAQSNYGYLRTTEVCDADDVCLAGNEHIYDSTGTYIQRVRTPLGLESYVELDLDYGVPVMSRDAYGNEKQIVYDTLLRPVASIDTYGNRVSTRYLEDSLDSSYITIHTQSDFGESYKQLDYMGRPQMSYAPNIHDSGQWMVSWVEYDEEGRVEKSIGTHAINTLKPYEQLIASPETDLPIKSFIYDDLGRTTEVNYHDGGPNTYTYYDPFYTIHFDKDGDEHTSYYNNRGQRIRSERQVPHPHTGIPVLTYEEYTYGPLGKVTSITDHGGNQWIKGYDRGRLVYNSDPDGGTTYKEYDSFGRISSVKDANGQAFPVPTFIVDRLSALMNYYYDDPYGRLTRTEHVDDGDISYSYKPLGEYGTGQIDTITNHADEISTSFIYDDQGRLTSKHYTIDEHIYQTNYSYDTLGRQNQTLYPHSGIGSRFGLTKNYHPTYGYMQSLTDSRTSVPYYRFGYVDYMATNDIGEQIIASHALIGDQLTVASEVSPITGRTNRARTYRGESEMIRDYNYEYDYKGNMLTRSNNISGAQDTYRYDPVDRLIGWTDQSGRSLSYTYDLHNNLIAKDFINESGLVDTVMIRPSGVGHQLEEFDYQGDTYLVRYDSRGRETQVRVDTDGDGTLEMIDVSYNSFNVIKEVADLGIRYRYDGLGNRVVEDRSDADLAEGDYLQKITIGSYSKEIYADDSQKHSYEIGVGKLTQSTAGEEVLYNITNHQGSVEAVVDQLGTIVMEASYSPFGMQIDMSSTLTDAWLQYTNHDYDSLLGTIDMKARGNDPMLGRMKSVDNYFQALNPYMYANNNPIRYTDPDGNWPQGWCIGAQECGWLQNQGHGNRSEGDRGFPAASGESSGSSQGGGQFGGDPLLDDGSDSNFSSVVNENRRTPPRRPANLQPSNQHVQSSSGNDNVRPHRPVIVPNLNVYHILDAVKEVQNQLYYNSQIGEYFENSCNTIIKCVDDLYTFRATLTTLSSVAETYGTYEDERTGLGSNDVHDVQRHRISQQLNDPSGRVPSENRQFIQGQSRFYGSDNTLALENWAITNMEPGEIRRVRVSTSRIAGSSVTRNRHEHLINFQTHAVLLIRLTVPNSSGVNYLILDYNGAIPISQYQAYREYRLMNDFGGNVYHYLIKFHVYDEQ